MKRSDEDFTAEIDSHVAFETDRLIADGWSADAARAAALKRFGNVTAARERFYESSRIMWVEHVVRDLRDAYRSARRTPLTTIVIVLSLAIGIGADTAVFTIANALLWRAPGGVRNPGELVDISRIDDGESFGVHEISLPDIRDLQTRVTTLQGAYAYKPVAEAVSFTRHGVPAERVYGHVVTSNYFDVLGVSSAAGRLMTATDRDRIVVLSHAFWTRRFQRDPSIIGESVLVNAEPFVVAGVASEAFTGTSLVAADVWIPVDESPAATSYLRRRDLFWGLVRGRLQPGTSIAQAAAEVATIGRQLAHDFPEHDRGQGFRVAAASFIPGNLALPLGGAFVVATLFVSIVLAIACANLTGVLLARAASRRRELAVRIAIGAGRRQIIRQLLIETAFLFACGASVGVVMARLLMRVAVALLPALPVPLDLALPMDRAVLLFTAGLTFIAALVAGLAPAFRASNVDPIAALKDATGQLTARSRLRSAFIVGQVCFSVVLLSGAAVFVKATNSAVFVDRGFDANGVATAELDLELAGYTAASGPAIVADLLARLEALPAQGRSALAVVLPSGGRMRLGQFAPDSSAVTASGRLTPLEGNIVTPGYFATLGIALLEGRDFLPEDRAGAPRAVIVSQEAARRFWPGQSAVGLTLAMQPFALRRGQPSEDTPLTVIGVVADIRLRRDEAARPEIYLPLAQHFRSRFNIVARAVEGSAAPDLLRTVAAVNPNLPIVSARSLDEVLTVNQLPQRITAAVASTLGLVGLLLAALGIYGVTAYLVATRTRELGIRMALGASRPRVVALVLTQACGLVLFGGALGVLVSIGALTTLASTAFGFPSGDVVSFAISFALMALAALIACLVPARHATALDPVATLRCD